MEKILQIALILTVVGQVCSENENEVYPGMFVVSSKGTTKSTDVLAKENKTNHLLSFTNTGELVDGMINTNISNSNEIRTVFERMKKLNVTTQCNIMDYTLFVVKFCQGNQKEQENQQQEQEPPKGTYSSNIKIIQQTYFFDGVWTLKLILAVEYKVKMSNKKVYTTCSRKQKIKSLEKIRGINKTDNEISHKRSQAETTVKKDDELETQRNGEDKDTDKAKEREHATSHDNANKGLSKKMSFLRPIYIEITVKTTTKLEDLEEGEILYYTFFDFQNQSVVIKAGKFKPDADSSNKTTVNVTGLNLVIEVTAKEGEHTFLIYDNRFEYLQPPEKKDIMSKKEKRITASYTCDVFNKVTLEKQAKGTLFSFNISSKERNQGRNLDQILMYISNEMIKEDHSVTHPILSKHKVSLSGCFHVKTDASNTITHGKPVKILEKVRKIESCNLCPTVVDKWLMDNLEGNELIIKNAHQEKDVKQLSKLVTCGTVTFEVSKEDNYDSSGPIPNHVLVFFLNTMKTLNEDGKETGKESGTERKKEEKLKKREILPKGEENAKYAYETIELLQPVFDKDVQNGIADIKKSVSAKFGKGIWDTAEYLSELKITRNIVCTDNSCQGSIKAVLKYNLTRKVMLIKRVDLQPRVNFKMLLRFQFFGKFIKPQPLPTALMKRLYSPKYRAQKMPMIKIQQAATPIHATKTDMPPNLNKAVPEGSLKLRFKAKGKRYPFSVFGQHKEFLEYEQKMGKYGQMENSPLKRKTPDFQVNNNNFHQYRDGEIVYDKKQQKEALKRAGEDKPKKKFNSGYALSVGKSIIIALVNCLLILKL